MQYNDSYSENIHSFVNVINTVDGGTHVTGFRTGLTELLTITVKKSALLKEDGEP